MSLILPSRRLLAGNSGKLEYIGATPSGNANASSITIDVHANARAGDLIVAFCGQESSSTLWPVTSGWTNYEGLLASGLSMRIQTRIIGPGETSYALDIADNTGNNFVRSAFFRKAAPEDAGHGLYGSLSGSGNVVAPALTSDNGGILLDFVFTEGVAGTHSTPSGMTAIGSTISNGNRTFSLFMQDVAAGSTGTRTCAVGGASSGNDTRSIPVLIKKA
jgi:hypothetical protein